MYSDLKTKQNEHNHAKVLHLGRPRLEIMFVSFWLSESMTKMQNGICPSALLYFEYVFSRSFNLECKWSRNPYPMKVFKDRFDISFESK